MAQEPLVDEGLINVEVSRSHWDTTLSAIPLDEWSALRRDLNLTTHNFTRDTWLGRDSNPQFQQPNPQRPTS